MRRPSIDQNFILIVYNSTNNLNHNHGCYGDKQDLIVQVYGLK